MSGYRSDGVNAARRLATPARCTALHGDESCVSRLRSFVASCSPQAFVRIAQRNDSRLTCMMPAESCSRLSRRFTTFLSIASVLHAASEFFETFARRAPGRARRASCNKRPFCTKLTLVSQSPRPRRERHYSQRRIKNLLPAQVVRRVPRAQRRRRQPPQQIIHRPARRRRLPRLTTR